jgi:hypothetical protein
MEIRFVPLLPHGTSQRDKELVRSQALSHAARVHHRRRQARGRRTRQSACATCGGVCPSPCQQYRQTVLVGWLGNSDPFDARAIAVTPRVNEIIYFYQSYWLPASYGPGSSMGQMAGYLKGSPQQESPSVHLGTEILDDICCANAFLFAHLTLMNRFNGFFDDEAEVLGTKSLSLLRLRMAQMTAASASAVVKSILMLFAAAVFAEDGIAVRVHGDALTQFIIPDRGKATVSMSFLTHNIWLNAQLLAPQLGAPPANHSIALAPAPTPTPPSDLPRKVSRVDSGFALSTTDLPFHPTSISPLDESVSAEPLRSFFLRIRTDWAMRDDPNHSTFHPHNHNTSQHPLTLPSTIHTINANASDTANPLPTTTTATTPSDSETFTQNQRVLTTTLIQYVTLLGLDAIVGAQGSFINGSRPVDLMRSAVLEAWGIASWGVLVFSCYVGGISELQTQDEEGQEREKEEKQWFTARLARLASGLSWEDVKGVLDRFLPTDPLQPHGSEWVEDIISHGVGVMTAEGSGDVSV